MNYPWHEPQWQQFLQQYQKKILPHALLLYGPQGLAKKQFALRVAQALLCEQFSESYCGQCHSCTLFSVGNHPDFILIEPEEKKSIGIAEIRELILQLQFTQHSAAYKIVIINPAARMTYAACNALLKSLEEPPAANTLLLLITESIARLPATIVSRCHRMSFSPPSQSLLLDWLKKQKVEMPSSEALAILGIHYDNAPLRILSALAAGEMEHITKLHVDLNHLFTRAANPITLARRWQDISILLLLDWMLVWAQLQLRQQRMNLFSSQRLLAWIDNLYQIKQIVLRQVSLNQLLLLETLFITLKNDQEIIHGRISHPYSA